jgi:hypothetical protein
MSRNEIILMILVTICENEYTDGIRSREIKAPEKTASN